MAVIKTIDNTAGPAGTPIVAGTNAEIDAAFNAGTLTGFTKNSDGAYIKPDGTPITSAGGTTEVVDLSGATSEELAAIKELATNTYLSQNTGVLTSDMNASYISLGLDPNDTTVSLMANKILTAAGYKPGEQADFYGDNDITDAAARVLNDKWQQSAELQAQLDAEGNGEILVNNNVANSLYLAAELSKQGINPASTKAIIRTDYGVYNVPSGGSNVTNPETGKTEFKATTATADDGRHNMLEWDNLFKKDKVLENRKFADTTVSGSDTNVQQMQPTTAPAATSAEVYSPDPNTFKIEPAAVTPYFNPANTSPTSTTTNAAENFSPGIQRQETKFKAREPLQAMNYQPQTQAEMTAAGQDISSYEITQKLFRNPNTGHQLYIAHQGGNPLSPIPEGYREVNAQGQFVSTANIFNPVTAGGNATKDMTSANQGGMIQGFHAGGDGGHEPHQHRSLNGTRYSSVKLMKDADEEFLAAQAANTADTTGTANTANTADTTGTAATAGTGVDGAASTGFDPSKVYGDVSFQNPVTGQTVTQNAPNYYQTLQNKVAQSTINPASTIAPMGVQYGQETPGTVLESTAGQSLALAPVIADDEIAQVSDVTQSTGAVNPGAAQSNLTQAAPTIKTALEGLSPELQQAAMKDADGNIVRNAAGNIVYQSAPTEIITGQEDSTSSISTLSAATKGTATDVTAPAARKLQTGEKIVGTGVDQSKVDTAFGTGQVTAASITDELTTLMNDFEGGNTPPWAAGAMRNATAAMAARGLGASTMAGQAIIQAAMESALPIAQVEAGNKQQVALFNGEQRAKFLGIEFDQAFQAKVTNAARVSEIANMNFTASQTIALENSRAANTLNLTDLSNKQALVMSEAAALSQLDVSSLNNRQQAAVQNAQNFLQVDMANLTNSQATAIFKSQQASQAMLSDTAQANATAQFNATSENQTNQFFSNLASQVSQFNSAQKNAVDQFNAEETNAILEFNSALQNQREMFNSQNYLAVAQANAVWRQNLNTSNTEAQNLSNAQYAKDVNGLSQKALDDFWQKERDIMAFTFAQSESQADRAVKILLGEMSAQEARETLDFKENANKAGFWSKLILGDVSLASGLNTYFNE